MVARAWDKHAPFVAALEAREYVKRDANGKLVLVMPAGVYLYLHELFLDGIQHSATLLKATVEISGNRSPAEGPSQPPR